jgi:uncharacterized protein YajQ (UPF0234 family)
VKQVVTIPRSASNADLAGKNDREGSSKDSKLKVQASIQGDTVRSLRREARPLQARDLRSVRKSGVTELPRLQFKTISLFRD